MSRGSPRVTIRISPELLRQVDAEIARSEEAGIYHVYDRSGFILDAIRYFVRKRQSSRAHRKPRKRPPAGGTPTPDQSTPA